jgi:hypothetical protein
MKTPFRIIPLALLSLGSVATASALTLSDGVATFTINTETLSATLLNEVTGTFGINGNRTSLVPANMTPFSNASPSFTLGLNPLGTANQAGRQIQSTTLDFDPSNVRGSWSSGTDTGAFLSNGEQIGLGGGLRVSTDFDSYLLFGDFGLRYSAGRDGVVVNSGADTLSGLVLASNIDFGNATFANIANANFEWIDGTLTIQGDLLFAEAYAFFGDTAALNVKFGTFSLTANTAAVPEPSSYALLFGAFAGGLALSRRRRR